MLEASYASLASNLGSYYGLGGVNPPRTGNRHGGMSMAPYNVYPATDGHIAIVNNNDTHWRLMCGAFGHPEMADDPRFDALPKRVSNMDALDALISDWTRPLSKQEAFDRLAAVRVPSAPVRDLDEVVNDPHLHARGALHWIDHPEYGRIVVQASPIRFRGENPPAPRYSPALGVDTEPVLSRRLGLSRDALDALRHDGVI